MHRSPALRGAVPAGHELQSSRHLHSIAGVGRGDHDLDRNRADDIAAEVTLTETLITLEE
jgi:hypothetical protein